MGLQSIIFLQFAQNIILCAPLIRQVHEGVRENKINVREFMLQLLAGLFHPPCLVVVAIVNSSFMDKFMRRSCLLFPPNDP